MTRAEWTNTQYRGESRGATLYGLPYDTSGRSLLSNFEPSKTDAQKDAESPYPLMVKFTKNVLIALYGEKVKARNIMKEYTRDTAEFWEAWCRVAEIIKIEDYYFQRLYHYREPDTQPLPKSLLA